MSSYKGFIKRRYKNFIRRKICSYGIIAYTIINNEIKYLLTQRRDSIAYIEYIKNNISDEELPKYINLMTLEEKHRILGFLSNFNAIWKDLWINHRSKMFINEYESCKKAFENNTKKYMNLFKDDNVGKKENDWGFPKGRKHMSETEIECAKREFVEETCIPLNFLSVNDNNQYIENYIGSDNKNYTTILYVGYLKEYDKIEELLSKNKSVANGKNSKVLNDIKCDETKKNLLHHPCISEEISQLRFVNYAEAYKLLNIPKRNILRKINDKLLFKLQRKKITLRKSSFI